MYRRNHGDEEVGDGSIYKRCTEEGGFLIHT
jgi:hypothetical protein